MRPGKYHTWTNKQVARLKQVYFCMNAEELEKELAPHPIGSIRGMARKLRLRPNRTPADWMAICSAHVMQTGLFKVSDGNQT